MPGEFAARPVVRMPALLAILGTTLVCAIALGFSAGQIAGPAQPSTPESAGVTPSVMLGNDPPTGSGVTWTVGPWGADDAQDDPMGQMPSSPTDGPFRRTTDGLPSGFAPTATGAALAAAFARLPANAPVPLQPAAVREYVSARMVRTYELMLEATARSGLVNESVTAWHSRQGEAARAAGRVLHVRGLNAAVDSSATALVTEYSELQEGGRTSWFATTMTMVREGGTWKLLSPIDGDDMRRLMHRLPAPPDLSGVTLRVPAGDRA